MMNIIIHLSPPDKKLLKTIASNGFMENGTIKLFEMKGSIVIGSVDTV